MTPRFHPKLSFGGLAVYLALCILRQEHPPPPPDRKEVGPFPGRTGRLQGDLFQAPKQEGQQVPGADSVVSFCLWALFLIQFFWKTDKHTSASIYCARFFLLL